MARPLRIEFPGILYHVTSRGNALGAIFLNDDNRTRFLDPPGQAIRRYDWYCHAYCLMDNNYHILIETGTANLSKGMKYLNGSYTQSFNRQHQQVGHVFQGRYVGTEQCDEISYINVSLKVRSLLWAPLLIAGN